MSRGPRASPSRSGCGGSSPGAHRTSPSGGSIAVWRRDGHAQGHRRRPRGVRLFAIPARSGRYVRSVSWGGHSRDRRTGATKPRPGKANPAGACCSTATPKNSLNSSRHPGGCVPPTVSSLRSSVGDWHPPTLAVNQKIDARPPIQKFSCGGVDRICSGTALNVHFFWAGFLHRPQISTTLIPLRPPASFLKVDFFLGEVHSSSIISREQSKKTSWM
mgnify:CR=1 FL=1